MVGVTGTRYVSVLRFVCGVQLMLVNIRCLCQGRSNRTALRTQSWGLMSEIEALTVQFKVLGKSLGFPASDYLVRSLCPGLLFGLLDRYWGTDRFLLSATGRYLAFDKLESVTFVLLSFSFYSSPSLFYLRLSLSHFLSLSIETFSLSLSIFFYPPLLPSLFLSRTCKSLCLITVCMICYFHYHISPSTLLSFTLRTRLATSTTDLPALFKSKF